MDSTEAVALLPRRVSCREPQVRGIEVEDLVKVYPGGKAAVDGVSFTVGGGEIFGFLGPNG
jgi:ABC-type sugar transport system ATPase subunit